MENALDYITLVASLVAVAISVFALRFQRRLEHETSTQTLIHDQYELCRVIDVLRVEHPEVSHMFALPLQEGKDTWKNYKLFKRNVRSMLERGDANSITEAARATLYLQEHAAALHVCDIYEQTLFQRQLAEKAGDTGRFSVLNALVEYYEGRMLRNPRIRFHWNNGASDMMEAETRTRYDAKVRAAHPHDVEDPESPLDAASNSQ